tara:strand:- start:45 stop:251 length:207 start_codon:yes stop_codon:yes gene_type:complete
MKRIIIKPEAVENEYNNILFSAPWPSILNEELILIELDKKKIKKNGKYIGISNNVMGLKVRTEININL